ncbi:class I SAM-dependent methyltransferase [Actinoplanes sp. NPDC026623]|uniref:class I SAM-dependent methyltransferase n=1 Tax=Actinoplanes sp. NPDC026623 TaxID=3155610 RepID=UPI0034044078
MNRELVEHYGVDCVEDTRLRRSAHGRLEYLRTQELIRRWLPASGRYVVDVGGGTGVHAAWLAADGHTVHVIDPVPAHVQSAAARPGVTAQLGDARALDFLDDSADVVLLLGPLYHLTDSADRARALDEAVRVLRPGGILAAAGISRYLSLLELGADGRLTGALEPAVRAAITAGDYDGHVGFVTAHFHTAEELATEVRSAGLTEVTVYGVEGPAWPALDTAGLPVFDNRVDAALRCARLVERDPLLINTSAHLLALAQKQPVSSRQRA